MALKKKGSKKSKTEKAETKEPKQKKQKKETKSKKSSEPKVTRKGYIMDLIKGSGKSGIATEDLVKKVDKQFNYPEGKTSLARVKNTIRDGLADKSLTMKENGIVKVKK